MTDTPPDRLIKRLRPSLPSKHFLDMMLDDFGRDNDTLQTLGITTVLKQRDYPTVKKIIENAVSDMSEAADLIETKDAEIARLRRVLEEILEIPNSEAAQGVMKCFARTALPETQTEKEAE